MPHSISLEDSATPDHDAVLAETETDKGETQSTEVTVTGDLETSNGVSQESDTVDQDMTMADVGVEGDKIPDIKAEIKSEVKLEDLFADMDSDEEFPSSTGNGDGMSQDLKASSSPEVPSSPV